MASHGYDCRSGEIIGTALELTEDDVEFSGPPMFYSGGRLVGVALPLPFGIPTYGALGGLGQRHQQQRCARFLLLLR
jgi:hypothetical protein